jgi:hypothetical protein
MRRQSVSTPGADSAVKVSRRVSFHGDVGLAISQVSSIASAVDDSNSDKNHTPSSRGSLSQVFPSIVNVSGQNWCETYDGDSTYWTNSSTGAISHEAPVARPESPNTLLQRSLSKLFPVVVDEKGQRWQEDFHQIEQKSFWRNLSTQEIVWHNPKPSRNRSVASRHPSHLVIPSSEEIICAIDEILIHSDENAAATTTSHTSSIVKNVGSEANDITPSLSRASSMTSVKSFLEMDDDDEWEKMVDEHQSKVSSSMKSVQVKNPKVELNSTRDQPTRRSGIYHSDDFANLSLDQNGNFKQV